MPTAIVGQAVTASAEVDASEDGSSSLEVAYELTRRAILHADLKPGTVISQVKLAQRIGVSRTPLREALRLLQREGLVEAEHNRRVRIAAMSVDDLQELYALRITIEAMAIRVSIPFMTNEDFDTLSKHLACMHELQDATVDEWEIPHREFHRRLVRYSGERIQRTIEELSDHAERYRRAFISQMRGRGWNASSEEHSRILACCKERNVGDASAALARHLARTPLTVMMHEAPEHEPALVRAAVRAVTECGDGVASHQPSSLPLRRPGTDQPQHVAESK